MKTGTKEWAAHSANCVRGCSNDCLYCYAAHMACVRFQRRPREDWHRERINEKVVEKCFRYKDGVTMFPTTHDITPGNLGACMTVLRQLLWADRQVLVVSKPHWQCIDRIIGTPWARRLRDKLEFRFSITCLSDGIRAFWEPNAPTIPERITCLLHAYSNGFKTSVSMEPLLEPWNAPQIVNLVTPATTGHIWIGAMKDAKQRCAWRLDPYDTRLHNLLQWQSTEGMQKVYCDLKGNPKVHWKDTYQKSLGLAGPEG